MTSKVRYIHVPSLLNYLGSIRGLVMFILFVAFVLITEKNDTKIKEGEEGAGMFEAISACVA